MPLPRLFVRSFSFAALSPHAVKLLFDLLAQYNGFNNGDMSAAWKLMSARGWKSRDTLAKAMNQLIDNDFVIKTRQGGMHKCSLYAVTLYQIDDCRDKQGRSKFDPGIKATAAPPGGWFRDSISPHAAIAKPQKGGA
jgi:hypothetical protein